MSKPEKKPMRMETLSRIVAAAFALVAFGLYLAFNGGGEMLLAVLLTIVALIAPEVVDSLPWGPSK